jgi:RNA polymerase sigma factor (TIGR02999 family)
LIYPIERIADAKPDIVEQKKFRCESVTASAMPALPAALLPARVDCWCGTAAAVPPSMTHDITLLLRDAADGNRQAADQVVSLLYADLQRLARSRLRRAGDVTMLDTTSLVHESYLRLLRGESPEFADRRHFLAYAAQVMRSIVVDLLRSRQADRRGGGAWHVTLNTEIGDSAVRHEDEVLRVHEALDELAGSDARVAQVVQMRYFGGLSEAEIADCLGVTERTVQRDWQKARLFLSLALK